MARDNGFFHNTFRASHDVACLESDGHGCRGEQTGIHHIYIISKIKAGSDPFGVGVVVALGVTASKKPRV